jgi:hypothetical protein
VLCLSVFSTRGVAAAACNGSTSVTAHRILQTNSHQILSFRHDCLVQTRADAGSGIAVEKLLPVPCPALASNTPSASGRTCEHPSDVDAVLIVCPLQTRGRRGAAARVTSILSFQKGTKRPNWEHDSCVFHVAVVQHRSITPKLGNSCHACIPVVPAADGPPALGPLPLGGRRQPVHRRGQLHRAGVLAEQPRRRGPREAHPAPARARPSTTWCTTGRSTLPSPGAPRTTSCSSPCPRSPATPAPGSGED